jgi:hypothetical protein
MKLTAGVIFLALTMACVAVAQQDPTKPVLREGKSVQMPVSSQATAMRDADGENTTVVAVTAEGNLFVGIRPAQLSDLGKLKAETVYVKADARVPYQQVLMVLDELRGHSLVLLTSSPSNAERSGIVPPYGVKVMLGPH